MPMICKVTGFSFTPIHKFVPSKQSLGVTSVSKPKGSGAITPGEAKTLRDTNVYGPERFIQLDDGGGNNAYDN